VTVAVHDLGGDGPALVLVHAAGVHGMVFRPLARRLAGGFHSVAPDLRGHGDTPLPDGTELDFYGMAADVLTTVDDLDLERPFGFGHSSGGTVLLLAEQARPGTFAALYCYEPIILAADPPLGRDPDNWLAAQTRMRRATFASRDEALQHFRSRPILNTLDAEALHAYVDHGLVKEEGGGFRLKCDPEAEAAVYETATAHDAWGRLPDIACPVTVACGADSEVCPPPRASAVAQRLHAGRLEVLPGLGHLAPLERPIEVAASVVRAFS
jgi:pimeloyl-ACP methyl ester carboxylesterase